MTQQQLNQARAMRLSGLTIREIVSHTGLTYFQVRDNTTPPKRSEAESVEVVGRRLLAAKPSWFKGCDTKWRELVEANFGKVGI